METPASDDRVRTAQGLVEETVPVRGEAQVQVHKDEVEEPVEWSVRGVRDPRVVWVGGDPAPEG